MLLWKGSSSRIVEVQMATKIGPVLTVADLDVMPDDGNHYELISTVSFLTSSS
jgi:hypothetical protein